MHQKNFLRHILYRKWIFELTRLPNFLAPDDQYSNRLTHSDYGPNWSINFLKKFLISLGTSVLKSAT